MAWVQAINISVKGILQRKTGVLKKNAIELTIKEKTIWITKELPTERQELRWFFSGRWSCPPHTQRTSSCWWKSTPYHSRWRLAVCTGRVGQFWINQDLLCRTELRQGYHILFHFGCDCSEYSVRGLLVVGFLFYFCVLLLHLFLLSSKFLFFDFVISYIFDLSHTEIWANCCF